MTSPCFLFLHYIPPAFGSTNLTNLEAHRILTLRSGDQSGFVLFGGCPCLAPNGDVSVVITCRLFAPVSPPPPPPPPVGSGRGSERPGRTHVQAASERERESGRQRAICVEQSYFCPPRRAFALPELSFLLHCVSSSPLTSMKRAALICPDFRPLNLRPG